MPGYENSYGRLGPVPLKPFTFYAGDEQPGWCGVPREAPGLRCASAKFDRPDRLKRFAPPTETSFMNPRALRTFVFYCSNHLEAGQFSGLVREHEGDMIRTISLSCAGKVDIPYLLKAFETGNREYLLDLIMMDPWTKSEKQAAKLSCSSASQQSGSEEQF